MKKAFSQKKFTENKKERCAINFFISHSVKCALDQAAKKTGLTRGDILSRVLTQRNLAELIQNQAYLYLHGDGQSSSGNPGRRVPDSMASMNLVRGAVNRESAEIKSAIEKMQAELSLVRQEMNTGFRGDWTQTRRID